MTKLNQLLAIEKGVNQTAQRQLTDVYHLLQRPQLFNGHNRTYQPKDDEGDAKPAESNRVQRTVTGLVGDMTGPLGRWFDVQLEKDAANLIALSDVQVDGMTFLTNVPTTHLLWLEKRLQDLKTVIEKMPVLDASEKWTRDEANGVYATEGVQTQSTTKVPTPVVKYPATDKHPAQTDMYNKDVIIGTWTTTKLSGAAEPSRQREALDRVEKLLAAVRQARADANSIDVPPVSKAGEAILDYIFAPIS